MALMVRTIKIDAIPARRERHLRPDSAFAHAGRQKGRVFFSAGRTAKGGGILVDAAVADAAGFASRVTQGGVAGEHSEAL